MHSVELGPSCISYPERPEPRLVFMRCKIGALCSILSAIQVGLQHLIEQFMFGDDSRRNITG